MAEWFPSPALLIAILMVLIFGPRVLRRLGHPTKAFKLFKYGWPLLVLAIVVEQSFLYFYLNKKIEQQDDVFYQFIEEAKMYSGGLENIDGRYCEYKNISLIYKYKICLERAAKGRTGFSLRFVEPAGNLSWLTRDFWGRDLSDRVGVWGVSDTGEVEDDYRKGIKNGQ